jgi:hypothetical protein
VAKANPAGVNFNGGEVGPLMSGRVDYEKFTSTCHRMQRFIPTVQGPAKRGSGTRHVLPAKFPDRRAWLQRFEFSYDQAYVLEFGHLYVRFFTDRGVVLESTKNITGATAANPVVITSNAHGYDNGQWVYITGVGGMTQLNGRYYKVANKAVNTYELQDLDGNPINGTGFTAYTSGGTSARVYEVVSPYAEADLTNDEGSCALSIVQSGDVLYIGCEGYEPRTLSRSSSTSWAFAFFRPNDGPFQFEPDTTETFTLGAASGTGVTLTSAGSFFTSAHVGMLLRIEPKELQVPPWEVQVNTTAGEYVKSDGKVYIALTSAQTGTQRPVHERGSQYDGRNKVDWEYQHPGYVVVRIASYTSATSVTCDILGPGPVAPVELLTGDVSFYRWGSWGNGPGAAFPSKCAFWRDRLWWSNGRHVYGSVAGDYSSHAPDTLGEVLADNAINLTLSIGTVDKIRWLRPSDALIVGTAGSEVAIREVTTNNALGPENVKFELQSAEGSREVGPVLVEDGILFVRVGGRRVVELRFDIQADAWVPRDMNVLYPEITRGGIVDMAYQKEPDDIIWTVLQTGLLVGLTYDREQNVYGWHQHPIAGTDAKVEAVQVISGPDGDVEDVWMIVARTINGQTRRHVEYFAQALESDEDIQGAVYLDASLEYDGAVAATLTPGVGATTAGSTAVTFTAGSSVFVAGDVGREIRVRYVDAVTGLWRTSRAEITGYTSGTIVTARILAAFTSTTAIASGGWRLTATTVRGLHHLEGQTVTAFADGQIVTNLVVSGGAITLPSKAARVQVGLPYTSILATQRIEAGGTAGTAQGKTKRLHKIVLRLYASLGGKVGSGLSNLDLIPYRRGSDLMDEPPPMLTGDTDGLAYNGGYETDGRVWVVCDQPLPFTLIAIYPEMHTYD